MKIESDVIILDKQLRKPKKITGTRAGAILGVNQWSTEFEAWCDITGVYKEPFEGNIYTQAGEILEPKVIERIKETISFGDILNAQQVYGAKSKYMYDYFTDNPIFGGMWDGLWVNDKNKPVGVVEIKTTKRYEDWQNGVPANYQAQAELYAMLLGVNYVTFGVVFLEESDYENLDQVELVEGVNYKTITYRLDEQKKIAIQGRMSFLEEWWSIHVEGLISPRITDKKVDQEIKAIIMTETVEDEMLEELVKELESVDEILAEDKYVKTVKRKKELEDHIRERLIDVVENDPNVESATVIGEKLTVSVKATMSVKDKFNEKLFKEEHPELYDKYVETTESITYRRSTKETNLDV